MDIGAQFSRSRELSAKVARVFARREQIARDRFIARVQRAWQEHLVDLWSKPDTLARSWLDWPRYAVDFAQRSVLMWDTLRRRGNNYLDHVNQGQPPLLHFAHETVLDGREFAQPVNYALLRILPPAGIAVDARRRPYIIIDPRAGHGPGIGGFKDDSQVGVALRGGHAVYFVVFFREPEAGQTLLDVCAAEQRFVHKVRELHPDSPKPAVVGNCQGGWAAMMLAASDPDATGPVVINGAPMSYWAGAWQEGAGDNPMRYAGGMLGGTWLSSLSADLGNGRFDGANLVQNFENLNPANALWDKYYHVFANIDSEPERFLEFERWWGGFYLMNREEIEWITRNLFVGNKLWSGETRANGGAAFDLRDIKSPIVLFASMGDNITPPQQAFNWVADVYGSTEEIKARGQVIVGLLHEDIGHLGIFVSGKVAKKEHAQIVSVLEAIDVLPPGLYGMQISEHRAQDGEIAYDVSFQEKRLEEVIERLNRFQRADEQAFTAVAQVSEFNQRAYELFAQPLIQSLSSEFSAQVQQELHPLRAQRWAISDLNPWLWWLGPAAQAVAGQRHIADEDGPARHSEKLVAELVSAALDYQRGMRDALSEAAFFHIYGNLFGAYLAAKRADVAAASVPRDPHDLHFVRDALAAIDQGGYDEAFARVAVLLAKDGDIPLSRLELRRDLARDFAAMVPDLPFDVWRRIRGEQEIIVRFEPEQAVTTLPLLLVDPRDRTRLLNLLQLIEDDERVLRAQPTATQRAMLERIRSLLCEQPKAAGRTAKRSRAATH